MDDKQYDFDDYYIDFFAPSSPKPIYKSNKKHISNDELVKQIKQLLNKNVDELIYLPKEEGKIKCECGAEKAKTPHSNWCPVVKESDDE